MAFLFEESRGLTEIKDPYPHLGPGVYQQEVNNGNKHAYAPFGSTDKRVTGFSEKSKSTQPGPGQYEISQNLGESGVQAYMNKSTIIVKVQGNGSAAFKSQQERFNQKANKIPGPGSYNIENKQDNQQNNQDKQNNNRIEELRQQNNQRKINSIPQTTTGGGMQYQDIESLVQHQQEIRSKQQQRILGPTTYDVKLPQKQNGIRWDRNTQPRFKEQQSRDDNNVGPGKYNPQDLKVKKNPTPAFLSESVRSYFDNMIYNTNSELKAELRKRTNYRGQSIPGPGSYEENRAAISIQHKARAYQFFGSSLERFKMEGEINKLGPGTYNLNSSFDVAQRKKNFTNATFLSTSVKDDSVIKEESYQIPGPGQYEQVNDIQHKVVYKYDKGYKGNFGSKQKRFDDQQLVTKAGPGSYNINNTDKNRAVSSSFKSNTKRDIAKKDPGPSIGQYKLDQHNIGTKLIKMNRFLKNLERIDVQRPGFDSGQQRFREAIQPDVRERSYTTDNVPNQSINNNNNNNNNNNFSSAFRSNIPRIGYLQNSHTPGVGKYQVDKNSWNINSFNTHYNKLLAEDSK